MTTTEKIANAKKRIDELERLINYWNESENDKSKIVNLTMKIENKAAQILIIKVDYPFIYVIEQLNLFSKKVRKKYSKRKYYMKTFSNKYLVPIKFIPLIFWLFISLVGIFLCKTAWVS